MEDTKSEDKGGETLAEKMDRYCDDPILGDGWRNQKIRCKDYNYHDSECESESDYCRRLEKKILKELIGTSVLAEETTLNDVLDYMEKWSEDDYSQENVQQPVSE